MDGDHRSLAIFTRGEEFFIVYFFWKAQNLEGKLGGISTILDARMLEWLFLFRSGPVLWGCACEALCLTGKDSLEEMRNLLFTVPFADAFLHLSDRMG